MMAFMKSLKYIPITFIIILHIVTIILADSLDHSDNPLGTPPGGNNSKGGNNHPLIPLHKNYNVKVFYYLLPDWGESLGGVQKCSNSNVKNMKCDWEYSGVITDLTISFNNRIAQNNRNNSITVAMYNIHSLWHKLKKGHPLNCELKTDYSIATSEESMKHPAHSKLFPKVFPNFDGYSTVSPRSTIQKIYKEAYLNETVLNHYNTKIKSFGELTKGGSYIASACHYNEFKGEEASRDKLVRAIREGFRVDGLGSCLKSKVPEGHTLTITSNTEDNLILKRDVISKYMFYMAFENVLDRGYVTEKVWDALIAGTVPVYWGDSAHLKQMIPHPKSVIFVSDFITTKELSEYLSYLSRNETAYEEHRNWRKIYQYEEHIENNKILKNSWYCRTCEWAVHKYDTDKNGDKVYKNGDKNGDYNDKTGSIDGPEKVEKVEKNGRTRKLPHSKGGLEIQLKDKKDREKDICH